jgi:hypothetical protein
MYNPMIEELIDFINSDPSRPVSERKFLPFKETVPCLEDEYGQA